MNTKKIYSRRKILIGEAIAAYNKGEIEESNRLSEEADRLLKYAQDSHLTTPEAYGLMGG